MAADENGMLSLQTTAGIYKINNNDRILIHEHIFNRFPYWKREKMEKEVLKELHLAFDQGITVICDLTAYTKPYNYYEIIEKSPIKIISCIGFYTSRYVPAQQKRQTEDALFQTYKNMIEEGIGINKIKPGILKIAAGSYQLNSYEEEFFSVVSALSKEYCLPVALHAPRGAYSHVTRLLSKGVNPNKLFVAHVENGITSRIEYEKRFREAIKILEMGAYVQLADFGCTENSKKKSKGLSFTSGLIDLGFINQLLLSADSCWRFKNGEFMVKEHNLGNGKHYTYTKEFILPSLQIMYPHFDVEQIFLHDNVIKLFT